MSGDAENSIGLYCYHRWFEILWNWEGGQQYVFLQVEHFHFINDGIGIIRRFWNITEEIVHLFLCFKIKLVIRKLKAPVL